VQVWWWDCRLAACAFSRSFLNLSIFPCNEI
jgi:hypothetical protein